MDSKHHKHPHFHNHSAHHGDGNNHGRAFGIAIALNTAFVMIEFAYGFVANSTALMADATHNLSDVLGLLLAWGATLLGRKAPNERYTYGLRSTSILTALLNAIFLLLVCGALAWEAVQRLSTSTAVAGQTVILVAAIGVAINGVSAWLFMRKSQTDLNIRGAYLHMLADAAISLGVVLAGVAMMLTGWYWLDSVLSLGIVAVIVLGTWQLLRGSLQLALGAVPAHIDGSAVHAYLSQCAGVTAIHDLHIWGMSTTENALTVHLVMPQGYPGDDFIDDITNSLKERFNIHHSTLQVEQGTTTHACTLHPSPTGLHVP